jgi:hypothetical protein
MLGEGRREGNAVFAVFTSLREALNFIGLSKVRTDKHLLETKDV